MPAHSSPSHSSPLAAYGVALAGVGLFSVMDMLVKSSSLAVGTFSTLWWRGLLTLLLAALLYAPRRHWPSAAMVRLHLVRGLVGGAMAFTFFWGLARVPMAQAIGLAFIAPLIALYLSSVFLHERVGPRLVTGSLLGFGGVVLILTGQARAATGGGALLGSASILLSAFLYAINIVLMRKQAMAAEPREIAFFQSLGMLAALALALPFVGHPSWPTGQEATIGGAALLGLVSAMLLAVAYARAPASYLSTTEYSGLLYAMLLGWLAFGERVSPWTLAGAGLVVVGCLIAARGKIDHPAIGEAA